MSIVRLPAPERDYYPVKHAISRDKRLGWAARGLLIHLLSRPDNWKVSVANLCNEVADSSESSGRDRTYKIISQLIDAGYMARVRLRKKGAFSGQTIIVGEDPAIVSKAVQDIESDNADLPDTAPPDADSPDPENPDTALPDLDTRAQRKNDSKEIPKKEEISTQSAANADLPHFSVDNTTSDFGKNIAADLNANPEKPFRHKPDPAIMSGTCRKHLSSVSVCHCKDCKIACKRLILNAKNLWQAKGYFDSPQVKTLLPYWTDWNTTHSVQEILDQISADIRQKLYKPGEKKHFSTVIDSAICSLDYSKNGAVA